MNKRRKLLRLSVSTLLFFAMFWVSGCAAPKKAMPVMQKAKLSRAAWDCLGAGVRYQDNPAVRAQAVEAMRHSARDEALPWIRSSLLDNHPAVRFAGCMAVGELADERARSAVEKILDDADDSVRIAAIFAVHRLGDTSHTAKLTSYLLRDDDPLVRRNAAMVLGRLREHSAVMPLAQSMKDSDGGVRNYALEAMALLENKQAIQELTFMANTGVGAEEVFAVQALSTSRSPRFIELFRYKLVNAVHIETRLAAAKGLGMLGLMDGFGLALRALKPGVARKYESSDGPEQQQLRTWLMASSALGAMGNEGALPGLMVLMESSKDPRVQVSAAQAILQILQAHHSSASDVASLFKK